jgi:hypothetical protein
MSGPVEGRFLVDGHAHLYPAYDREAYFDRARAHAAAAGARLACLLLAETARDRPFAALRAEAAGPAERRWSLRPTAEPGALLACQDGEPRLVLVAGRQVQSAEGLELLALFCTAELADGLPLREAIAAARAAGALAVLPWGFGKWWLGRGRLLRAVLRADPGADLWLGDNGGRPRGLPPPPALRRGARAGRPLLPGSDTLPLAGEAGRAAHYGCVLEGRLDLERPAAGLRQLLLAAAGSPRPYGRRIGPARFVRNQLALRLAARAGQTAPAQQ